MSKTASGVTFAVVPADQRPAALAMLVSHEPPSDQASRITAAVDAIRQANASTGTLMGANRGNKLVAAAWGQILPGKTALIWPPRLAAGEGDSIGDKLLTLLNARLADSGLQMAQAVLLDNSNPDASRLGRCGYDHAADLLYLISDLRRIDSPRTDSELEFETYQPIHRHRLCEVVERTYIETQDIPALDGVRDIDDVLDGYERTGDHSPNRWFFLRAGKSDVGCLLLTDHPQQNQWELVYVGIVPEARGNSWGSSATRFAQQQAKLAGRARLILAVDAANAPAVNAYTKTGFVELLRRTIYLKIFESNTG